MNGPPNMISGVRRNSDAEAEANRKAEEAEQQRLAAAAKAEEERKAKEAEQQRLAALVFTRAKSLGCLAARAASDRLRFDVLRGTADGMKAIQVKVWGQDANIEDVTVGHFGDYRLASLQKRLFVKHSAASAPIRLENLAPLQMVYVTYVRPESSWLQNPSVCIEGLQ